ncbi:MAG: bifunctional riboflavin kinase/FAD synthetase [Candidatus Dadabacteria bacterium]|nr:bifunctional riboflavin kinase/FAD synthetase [Candidatus Dadabacteria bacterium]NIQ15315.1 bifunctional riboflavin kinase/FAD synthetase [Candidatus Dadabacteria bacterium]
MEIIKNPTSSNGLLKSSGIGNFDGVHLGHKKIIQTIKDYSSTHGTKSAIITFDPHPQKVLGKRDISLIYPFEQKVKLLKKEGIDYLICLSFTEELSKLSAEEFIKNILVDLLRIKNIVVGPGFTFGNQRKGNIDLLKSKGIEYDFKTIVVEPAYHNNLVVSSTLIRNYIEEGAIEKANDLFGSDYFIEGVVVEGEKRGREIGFPTVNLKTNWELLPKNGVYATYVNLDNKIHQSITNIGFRPTFGENQLLIETHIFDYSNDLYGKSIKVNFVKRLRDEKKFDAVDSLVRQIHNDVNNVKEILKVHSIGN